MEVKNYQQRVLDEMRNYLQALNKATEDKIAYVRDDAGRKNAPYFDASKTAWREINSRYPYDTSLQNKAGEDIPFVCLKVPTGGGKTYLAVRCIEQINIEYRKNRLGVVLWIVPSDQIYTDTRKALRNREHPYRQMLDRLSGGRTLVVEKNERFTRQQVQENLVVIMLMLPSANRENKETLKIFQDNTNFDTFLPLETDIIAHRKLVDEYQELDYFGSRDQFTGVTVKSSFGNVLRMLRPLVILDEGHKAYGDKARETLKSLNPSFILELSATPNRKKSNILVEVTGQELNREEMIKLDINVVNKASSAWEDTLLNAYERIKILDVKAREYQQSGGRYIRPICLIQVEYTGDKQKGKGIHADDAQKFLVEKCGIHPDKVKIKSATNDGLENIDLLSPDCPIQFIITHSALQEGWDCPFAYVLAILSKAKSDTAVTQLVGRILRQPYARKTKIPELDESYVYCYQSATRDVVASIKKSFEKEGLGDLKDRAMVVNEDENRQLISRTEYYYRSQFRRFAGRIYLPRFVIQETNSFRPLSYETDILGHIDWNHINIDEIVSKDLSPLDTVDVERKITLSDNPSEVIETNPQKPKSVVLDIEPIFMVRQLEDIVPNAWVASKLINQALNILRQTYSDKIIASQLVTIISHLKQIILKQLRFHEEEIFRNRMKNKEIVFFLEEITSHDYVAPEATQAKSDDSLLPVQKSLFEYQPESQLNGLERSVALYLDKQTKLLWWYKNLVKGHAYKVQGWRRNAIYPDFISAKKHEDDDQDYSKIFVIETKGLHLKNEDSEYKGNIFELCNQLGRAVDWESLGEEFPKREVSFELVYEDEWRAKISAMFS